MNIVRPPEGFKITWVGTVDLMIKSQVQIDPEFQRYWDDVIERLKFTAHREGQLEPRLGNGYRLLAIDGGVGTRPRIVVGYLPLGESVTIKLLRIG